MRRTIAGLAALTTLVATSCGAGAPERGAPSESIGVHGDWTIEIYDQDGTLNRRLDFSNALTSGAEVLSVLLADLDGSVQLQLWGIAFGVAPGPGGTDPCTTGVSSITDNPDFTVGCVIEPATVEIDGDGQGVVLSGAAEVTEDGSFINWVETYVGYTDGAALFASSFTGTSIPEESVSAGQTVQVEVAISFTTG